MKYGMMDNPNVLTRTHWNTEEIKTNEKHIFLKTPKMRTGLTPRYTIDLNMNRHSLKDRDAKTYRNLAITCWNLFTSVKYPTVFNELPKNPVINGI